MGKTRSYKQIDDLLTNRINKIFLGLDKDNMSEYEKRKTIFNYICEHGIYDFKKLENISGSRDIIDELYMALDEKPAICSAFSQYYKLLLEKVGIYSVCLSCDDGTKINHQLNLVRNEDDSYSFDDVTSVIVNRGTQEEYFDYDIEQAHTNNQGNRLNEEGEYWTLFSTDCLYYFIDKEDNSYLKYGVENTRDQLILPSRIENYKTKINKGRKL